ncbi:MAG: flagellar hook-length control protein FliK [Hyphomonadaceae bacterium]|nr:flagellar hook-length control protein FliK [Hyphomonadaceae bacterium]
MDFAAEPVREAFPQPQTRSASSNVAPADDNGRSFDDHLEAVNGTRPEPAPAPDDDRSAPTEAQSARAQDPDAADEEIDVEAALLGGPTPPAPPPVMQAPVAIQIAAAAPEQTAQTQPHTEDAALAPTGATQPQQLASPAKDDAAAIPAQPAATNEAAHAKDNGVDVKDAAPKAAQTEATPQTQPNSAPIETEAAQGAAQQSATAQPQIADLPPAVQQVLAASVVPAQTTTLSTPRSSKDATQPVDAKAAPDARDGKTETPISHAKAQAANASRAADNGKVSIEAAPALPQPQGAAPDASQIAENAAISTTASQAGTHVQHASAETGAQRAAPAAQVGREIIRRFNGGTTNFELRLDPADLGRVEVRMEVTRDHRVTAVITADNPQALTELARGARELEQHLQSAGLQLSENGLSFDLRQGAQGGESDTSNQGSRGGGNEAAPQEQQQQAPVARPIGYERWRGVRVDMMV